MRKPGSSASGRWARCAWKNWAFSEALKTGLVQTWRLVDLTWQSFVKLAQRVVPADQVGGPIMIAQMVGQQAEQGLVGVLGLAALISINLAILNLLPVPVLDGGQMLFLPHRDDLPPPRAAKRSRNGACAWAWPCC